MSNRNFNVDITQEEVVINERYVDKQIDVYVEKPVPVYWEVEVPIDIIVEKPIEKNICRNSNL